MGHYQYHAFVRHPADASASWPVILGAHSYDAPGDGGPDLAIAEGVSDPFVPDARWAEVTATFEADGGGQAVRYFVIGPGATAGCVDIDDMTLTLDP